MSASLFAQSASPAKAKGKTAVTTPSVKEEVRTLRDLVLAQQQQLETQRKQVDELKGQIQQLLDATQQANANAQKVQTSAEQAQTAAAQAQQSATAAQTLAAQASDKVVETKAALSVVENRSKDEDKKISALQDLLGRFRFTGDIRIRDENFFQKGVADRNRARFRARFGVEGKLNEDFTGGILLTSGSLGDSNSTNETLSGYFTRKTIGIDRAYVAYNPLAAKWLSLTGGKFAATWQRTSLTFDPDINPEGFTQKLSFDLNKPVVKNFSAQAIQLFYSEASRTADSFAVGGQVSGKLDFGVFSSTPSFTVLNWRNVDAILNASAFSVQSPGEGPGCASGTGLPTSAPCVYGPQGFTNATYTDGSNRLHFLSGFLYADLILNNKIKTPWKRLPANLLLEYQNNLNAAEHPVDSSGNVLTDLGKQAHTYQVDFSLGQVKNTNDLQFGYGWWRVEQDAALASFLESEQRAPTNILQHHIYVLWIVRRNTVASYNLWVGRTLNSSLQHAALASGITPGEQEPYLKRMQFDLIYSF
jgi:hypothetical protein